MRRGEGQLPPIRIILKPDFGFGLDARIRFANGVNCFMSGEATLAGASRIAFGVEPRGASWLRLELAPSVRVSLRVPFLRLSEFKTLQLGTRSGLMEQGRRAPIDMSSKDGFLKSFRSTLKPVVEVVHRGTLLSAFFSDHDRHLLKGRFSEIHERRGERRTKREAKRKEFLESMDSSEMPPLDPRQPPPLTSSGSSLRRARRRAARLPRKTRDKADGPAEDTDKPKDAESSVE